MSEFPLAEGPHQVVLGKGKEGEVQTGVIAQEVEKELPFLVSTNGNGNLAVKYQSLIPLLIEAVKELSNKVKELEEKENAT